MIDFESGGVGHKKVYIPSGSCGHGKASRMV